MVTIGYHGNRMERIRVNISLTKLELQEVRGYQKSLTSTDGWNLPVTTLIRNAALHHLRGLKAAKPEARKNFVQRVKLQKR